MRKNKLVWSMMVLLLLIFSIPVYADNSGVLVDHEGTKGENSFMDAEKLEEVDVQQYGSIHVALTEGRKGTSRENVEFSCTKVGEIAKGEYILKEEFLSSGVDLNAIQSAKDMEVAAEKLAAIDINGENALRTDKDGKLSFSDLPAGVYFLEATDTARYEEVTPFLISIPTFDEKEGKMNYDITIIPKHEPEPGRITTDSPGGPRTPGAPQTGFDSPVLIYFAGAAVLALILIVFNMGNKKKQK